ncbi:MAG: putative regulator, ArsR family [Actinomycetia bacterium]|nr:putative regulator, ArsR family [Actinomycetes bacterium]
MDSPPFEARELVGLLADADRRRVFAALVLDAATLDDVRRLSRLDARAASRALQRLLDAGLVVRGDDGTLHLLEAAFAMAARAEAARAPRDDEHAGQPQEIARVMRAFVRDGRLLSIPTARAKRLVILDWLAQRFDPGERYSESRVNLILGQVHPDTAALRRYLVDEEYLTRERGEYWRSGGTVNPPAG